MGVNPGWDIGDISPDKIAGGCTMIHPTWEKGE